MQHAGGCACKWSIAGVSSTHLPSAYSRDPAARWAAASSDMALERLPLPLTGLQSTSDTLLPAGRQRSEPEAHFKPTSRVCMPQLTALLGDQKQAACQAGLQMQSMAPVGLAAM